MEYNAKVNNYFQDLLAKISSRESFKTVFFVLKFNLISSHAFALYN